MATDTRNINSQDADPAKRALATLARLLAVQAAREALAVDAAEITTATPASSQPSAQTDNHVSTPNVQEAE